MGLSDYILDKTVKILPIFGIFLFAYNSYLQLLINKNPLDSAFSLAVFLTFVISVVSVSYGHSLRQGSEKEKARTLRIVIGLFCLVGAGFLIRAWMVLPTETAWVVPASCTLPAVAILAFLALHRRLENSVVGK